MEIKCKREDIAIITPYAAQKNLLIKDMRVLDDGGKLEINSVDAF